MGRAVRDILQFIRATWIALPGVVIAVAVLQPLYFLSLVHLTELAPRTAIADHVRAAFEQGVLGEAARPRLLIFRGGDQFTECIALGIGLNPTMTSWETAITGARPIDAHPCRALHLAASSGPVQWADYNRYWHGYRMVLAPLAAAVPIWALKMINALMLAAVMVALWFTLRSWNDSTVATIFVMTFIFLSDVLFVWRSAPHAISLAYIFAGTLVFTLLLKTGLSNSALIVAAAVLGSMFNFIDFLINPPMMPMLLAFFVLQSARRDAGKLACAVVVAWFFGYAATWAAKWGIAYTYAAQPTEVASDIWGVMLFRTFGAFKDVDLLPLAATIKAFLRSLDRGGVIVPIGMAIAIAHYATCVARIDLAKLVRLSSPVMVPVIWFELLSNHTQIHATTASRSAAVAFAMLASALLLSMDRRPSLGDLRNHFVLSLGKLRVLVTRRSHR
jgi:hypothetical protein